MRNLLIVISLIFPLHLSAQYYDSAEDIYFYINESNPLYCIVLNFDGEKATYFNHTYQHTKDQVSRLLNSDPQYFESKTNDALYNMSFTSNFDGVAYIFHKRRSSNYSDYVYYDSYVMEFSENREYLIYKTFPNKDNPSGNIKPSKIERYRRVSKKDFLTRGRTR